MSEHNPAVEVGTPAFPGKVVALYCGGYLGVVAMAACRFETIAGRVYLVGENVYTNLLWPLATGVTRAVAWDSIQAENFILFDSREAFERWIATPITQLGPDEGVSEVGGGEDTPF